MHKISYIDLVNWLSDHEKAFKDYCEKFNVDFNNFDPDHLEVLNLPSPDKTMGWLMEHETLYSDFLYHFEYEDEEIKDLDATEYIILDMKEADSESDAQAIVDAWELKNKKDTGKADKVKFKIYLDEVKEPEEELKKLEHHFDWLYGDTNPGNYWDVKVDYHTDRYTIISGYISGVDKEDFEAYIMEGMDDYHALLKDIDWLEPLTGKELEKCIKDTRDEYEEVGQPFEQEEQFELINEEYLVDKEEFNKCWNKIVH